MKPLVRLALLTAVPLTLAVSLDVLFSAPVGAAKAQDVFVVNTSVPVAATQDGPWSVHVTNPQDPTYLTPVPLVTRDVNAADKQAVAYGGVGTFNDGDTQVVIDMGTVPADRFFVTEFLSAKVALPTPQRMFLILFSDVQHHFAPTLAGTDSGQDVSILSQPVSLTYTSGSLVRVTATRLNDNTGSGSVQIGLSGYSVRPCVGGCS